VARSTFDILTTEQTDKWNEILDQTRAYGFHHLPGFHRLPEIRGEGRSLLLVYRDNWGVIALPVVLRDISLQGDIWSEPLRDVTSVGGFVGPVTSSVEVSLDSRRGFQGALSEFFAAESVITAYQRLHPIIGNCDLFEGLGEVAELGITVAIDLSPSPEVQFARYEQGHRRAVQKLRKLGATCEIAGVECLDEFIDVYHETMRRAGARPAYFFDKPYFEYLLEEFPGITTMFICRLDGKTIGASMCASADGIAEAMYAGAADDYLHLSPIKLLNDYMRQWCYEAGARWLSLGGSGGGARDSQHYFRKAFGGTEFPFKVWRYVVDCDTYEGICAELRHRAGTEPSDAYFPEYRDPAIATVLEAAR
jgi:hypothetical protein